MYLHKVVEKKKKQKTDVSLVLILTDLKGSQLRLFTPERILHQNTISLPDSIHVNMVYNMTGGWWERQSETERNRRLLQHKADVNLRHFLQNEYYRIYL